MQIKVILADDHMVVREGIKAIVEGMAKDIAVIGEASNGNEVLKLAKQCPADIYVLDIAMPILNGMETAERLLRMDKKSRIILLSMYDNKTFVEQALKIGVKSYILKESATDEIIQAIREVYSGRYYLSPKISKYVVHGFLGKRHKREKEKGFVDLTHREKEVLQLISEGFSNKEIASRLKRSLNTIHVHRNRIMQKLDIHNQAELVRYALKEGISRL